MSRLSKILLRNLQLSHLRRLRHLVEDGRIGLTGLEVEWTILRLQDNILAELSVAGFEL